MTALSRRPEFAQLKPRWLASSQLLPMIVLLALILRLVWVLAINPIPQLAGGDGELYIHVAQSVANGTGLSTCYSSDCYVDPFARAPIVTVGPVYPLFLSAFYLLIPDDSAALQASRIADAVLAAATVAAVYWIARQSFGRRAGNLAAALMAIDLRFVLEIGNAHTEPLFTLLLALGVGVSLWATGRTELRSWALAGLIFGVAGLTRPIAFAVPLMLALYSLAVYKKKNALRAWLWFTAAFALAISPWLIRNIVVVGRPTLAEGAAANFWLGTQGEGGWEGAAEFTESLDEVRADAAAVSGESPNVLEDRNPTQEEYVQADAAAVSGESPNVLEDRNPTQEEYVQVGLSNVTAAPLSYAALLLRKLGRAYLQPSGTVLLGGESIKVALREWLAGERTLQQLVAIPAFAYKSYIYVFHFSAIIMALTAIALRWRSWRTWLLPALLIAFISGSYTLLTIIPRYLFPIMPLYTVLATGAIFRGRELQRK